jgi:hypothetical protein
MSFKTLSANLSKALLIAVTGYDPISNQLTYDEKIYDPIKKSWSKDVSNYQLHQKFNSEIMEVEIDYESQFIKMSVLHQSPIHAKELLELIVSKTNAVMIEVPDADLGIGQSIAKGTSEITKKLSTHSIAICPADLPNLSENSFKNLINHFLKNHSCNLNLREHFPLMSSLGLHCALIAAQ